MPGYERDQVAIDNTVENRHLGSVMLTAGWILLWMDGVAAIFFFQSLRNGSWFWPIWLAMQGIVGLTLVMIGTHYRRAIGVTRLSRRAISGILRQQAQDDEEERHVA